MAVWKRRRKANLENQIRHRFHTLCGVWESCEHCHAGDVLKTRHPVFRVRWTRHRTQTWVWNTLRSYFLWLSLCSRAAFLASDGYYFLDLWDDSNLAHLTIVPPRLTLEVKVGRVSSHRPSVNPLLHVGPQCEGKGFVFFNSSVRLWDYLIMLTPCNCFRKCSVSI